MTTTSWTGQTPNLRNPSIVTLADRPTAEMRQDGDYYARLLQVATRISSAAPLDDIYNELAEFAAAAAKFESCGVCVAEGESLTSRPAQSYHPEALHRVKIQSVIDTTGWTPGSGVLVAALENAWADPRAKLFFNDPLQDRFESFLSIAMVSGGRLVGAVNLIDRSGKTPDERAVAHIATLGQLAGAEIERARLLAENAQLAERLEARKIVERAKGILQRNLQMSEEDAYLTLQRESRQRRKSMREVAEAIVLSEDLKKKK
jgi:GAF domain-containing protein